MKRCIVLVVALVVAAFLVSPVLAGPLPLPRPGYPVLEEPPSQTAHDGQTLAGQAPEVQASYASVHGGLAAGQWVSDHHRALVRLEARIRIESDPNAPVILESQGLVAETAPGLIADGVVARGATYEFLIGCDDGSLWGQFGCGGVFVAQADHVAQPGDSGGGVAHSAGGGTPVRTGDQGVPLVVSPSPSPSVSPSPSPSPSPSVSLSVSPSPSPSVSPSPPPPDNERPRCRKSIAYFGASHMNPDKRVWLATKGTWTGDHWVSTATNDCGTSTVMNKETRDGETLWRVERWRGRVSYG